MSQTFKYEWNGIHEKKLLAGLSLTRLLEFMLCPRKFQDGVYVSVGTGKSLFRISRALADSR